MKSDSRILGFSGFLMVILLTSGCTNSDSKGIFNVSLKSDNYTYHSGGDMKLNASIFCPECLEMPENITIRVQGMLDKRGNYRIKEVRNLELKSIEKVVEFRFAMPRCYGCAGVAPGRYDIEVMALKNETRLWNGSLEIYLET